MLPNGILMTKRWTISALLGASQLLIMAVLLLFSLQLSRHIFACCKFLAYAVEQ